MYGPKMLLGGNVCLHVHMHEYNNIHLSLLIKTKGGQEKLQKNTIFLFNLHDIQLIILLTSIC
jgi:hypothetical protein